MVGARHILKSMAVRPERIQMKEQIKHSHKQSGALVVRLCGKRKDQPEGYITTRESDVTCKTCLKIMTIQKEKSEKTIVIFRMFGGDVIALFPGIPENTGFCSSYMHVGQHGSADYRAVIRTSRPATPEEYNDLKKELESAPYNYNFIVRKKYTRR